jgi:hypothetical protein
MFELRRGRGCVNLDPPGDGAPVVSVIIPVHNGGRWVGEAMDSILGQTLSELELLMVDDGSTDDSVAQIESRAAQDARVRLFRQSHAGAAAALNLALASARTPLMARLDADDVAHTSRLERQVAFLAEHPEVGAVGAWAIDIDAKGRLRGRRQPETDPQVLRQLLLRRNPFIHSAVTARTDIVRRVGGYRRAFDIAEDYDLWLRAPAARSGRRSRRGWRGARRWPVARPASTPRPAWTRRRTGEPVPIPMSSTPRTPRSTGGSTAFAAMTTVPPGLCGGCSTRRSNSPIPSGGSQRRRSGRKVLLQLCRLRPSAVVRAAWSLRA